MPSSSLTPSFLVRKTIDPSKLDAYEAEEAVRRMAKSNFHKYVFEPLAVVCGWPAGHFGASMAEGLMIWPPLRALANQFTTARVTEWDSRVPTWRVTCAHLHEALGHPKTGELMESPPDGQGSKWVVDGQVSKQRQDWEIEDWYVCFILLAMQKLNSEEFRALADWVKRAKVEEQVWIFYHALLFFHFQQKYALWHELPMLEKAKHVVTGDKSKRLSR